MMPAAMINLLGAPGESGPPVIRGLQAALAIPGVSVHWYGKAETRPFRKMGHVTVLDTDIERAREKAEQVRELMTIGSES
jgi:5-(carboxyamino)imidazole ribonucleotide synthase